MAIVDSPLLSLGARKSIGKTITFSRIKGQNVARQRVIPANPNTADQQTQRSIMAKAVSDFQVGGLTEDDRTAYNRWATVSYRNKSGYNLFVGQRCDYLRAGGDDTFLLKDVQIDPASANTADVEVTLKAGGSGTVYYGTSKSSQLSTQALVYDSGTSYGCTLSGLVEGATYYAYVLWQDDDLGEMRTGLYTWVQAYS